MYTSFKKWKKINFLERLTLNKKTVILVLQVLSHYQAEKTDGAWTAWGPGEIGRVDYLYKFFGGVEKGADDNM